MQRDMKLGDKMPDSRPAKWGSMNAGTPRMPQEFEDMRAGEPKFSEKWDMQEPSACHTSERFVEQNPSTMHGSDRFAVMEQERREDPYAMHPSEGSRSQPFREMKKEKPDARVERATQNTEFGKTREI